jgi:hypothetical protein
MYLIGNKTEIQAYINKVDAYNGYEGDTTRTWGEPRKHPDKELYAVQKNMSVEPDSDLTQKEELPSDWQPDDPLA